MNLNERKCEGKEKENDAKEKGAKKSKDESKKEFGKKAGMIASLVAAGALAVGCGSSITNKDAKDDVNVAEGHEADVDEDADMVDEDMVEDVPEVLDAPGEDVTGEVPDVVEDTEEDTAEDVEVVCEPYDDSRMMGLGVDASMTVGGVDVVYRGLDTSDNPVYDLYCGDVPIRTNISVAVDDSEVVDVPEQGFRATLSPFSASFRNSSVSVSVETI